MEIPPGAGPDPQSHIYTVSELTRSIKTLLEKRFPFVWVSGEISNHRRPASGHSYFTLKDDTSQISAVMFRSQAGHLKFALTDGLTLTGFGRLSVYEPRGTYQLILEYLEPGGVGALQVAFEQLRDRLAAEGLFDPARKRPLPFLPEKIAVITSPTGAVVHDILNICRRRFPGMPVDIVPVRVQGNGAAEQIAAALELLNRRADADVIILARGGGSLEDLHAFNNEQVARAIWASTIPVVSAVGHETDFTIADFVADLRAPTPSAAAELVVPVQSELLRTLREMVQSLKHHLVAIARGHGHRLKDLSARLKDPRRRIQDHRLRTDELTSRLHRAFFSDLRHRRQLSGLWHQRLLARSPVQQVKKYNVKLELILYKLSKLCNIYLTTKRQSLREFSARLQALNPLAVLSRGYSITRTLPEGTVVRDPSVLDQGQPVEIRVAKGAVGARIDRRLAVLAQSDDVERIDTHDQTQNL